MFRRQDSSCAICGGRGAHRASGDQGEDYSLMMRSCFNVEFQFKNSSMMCNRCVRKLKNAIIFKKQVLDALESFESKETVKIEKIELVIEYDHDTSQSNRNSNSSDELDNKNTSRSHCIIEDDLNSDDSFNDQPSTSLSSFDCVNRRFHQEMPNITPTDTECPICKEQFENPPALSKHYEVHISTFQCSQCSYSSLSKLSLSRHVGLTHSKKRFACKICKKTYVNKSTAAQHIRTVHNGIKLYICTHCPERFSDYVSRTRHMTQVHDVPSRTYVCPNCGREFERSSRLGEHIRREHIKVKKHTCSECDVKFFTKNELKAHMLKHTGIKNFHCEECGKSYARKKTLTEHLKIHSNLRLHVCHVCGKDFIQKCTLKSHLQTHANT